MTNWSPTTWLAIGQTDFPALPLEWRLRWNWNCPLGLTVAACAAAVLWVVYVYLRENSTAGRGVRALLAALRIAAIALLMFMLAEPTVEWLRFEKPRLVVLVDRSASMSTIDQYENDSAEVTRIKAWQQMLASGEQTVIDRWQSEYDVDVVAFDEQVQRIDAVDESIATQLHSIKPATSSTSGTRLGDAINYALRDLPGPLPVAIVVLTDGVATSGLALERAAEQARRMRVPLHTVAIGSDRRPSDVAVENLIVEEVVFPGDRLQVEATVRATGYAGKSVDVRLRDGKDRPLATTTIQLPDDETTITVSIAFRPSEPGELPVELSIEPLADERNTENNRVSQVVDVRDQQVRVLLVQSQPSYEYRALKSLLERDPAVHLHTLLQEADVDFADVDDTAVRSFPVGEQTLLEYDVLILGDVDLGLLPRSIWPLVERFVSQHGGGLVAFAGPRFMPAAFRSVRSMAVLLPMRLDTLNPLRSQLREDDTFAVYPTSYGWQSPSLQLGDSLEQSQRIWRQLPKLSWVLRLDDLKPGTQVLAECPEWTNGQGQPLPMILRHYVGAGEVLFHATDETWRWRFRSDDRYFARYWGQVVRRLGRGRLAAGRQGVVLTTDRSVYEPGDSVVLQTRFRNPSDAPADADGVVVQLQGTSGPLHELTLTRRMDVRGLFTTICERLPPDKYTAQIVSPNVAGVDDNVHFEINRPPQELAEVVVNAKGLRTAAEISGGKFYAMPDVEGFAEQLPPPRRQVVGDRPPRPLWNSHIVMLLFVAVLTSEWLLRRRYGML